MPCTILRFTHGLQVSILYTEYGTSKYMIQQQECDYTATYQYDTRHVQQYVFVFFCSLSSAWLALKTAPLQQAEPALSIELKQILAGADGVCCTRILYFVFCICSRFLFGIQHIDPILWVHCRLFFTPAGSSGTKTLHIYVLKIVEELSIQQ